VFALVVRFDLKAGAGEAFDQLVAETVAQIERHEPGTVIYACHTVHSERNARVFYELYEDRAAFEAHEEAEHVKRFLRLREQFVDHLRVEFLELPNSLRPSAVSWWVEGISGG
jgi:quinol monooxygenase YgiN